MLPPPGLAVAVAVEESSLFLLEVLVVVEAEDVTVDEAEVEGGFADDDEDGVVVVAALEPVSDEGVDSGGSL